MTLVSRECDKVILYRWCRGQQIVNFIIVVTDERRPLLDTDKKERKKNIFAQNTYRYI